MKFMKRWRWWALLPLPLAIIVLQSFGPDGWAEPLTRLLWLSWAGVVLAATHLATKALHDYADGATAWREAMAGNMAAAIAFLGRCILGGLIFASLMPYARGDVLTDVPPRAYQLMPVVQQQIEATWPQIPMRSYVPALIEQETCPSPQHRGCFSASARLKTAREEGAGPGQLTRAWDASGRERFDALAEVKALDPQGLRELDWQSVYVRADLGVRAILVKTRDCHQRLGRQAPHMSAWDLTSMCDAAYNGGLGGLLGERRLCAMAEGCDPDQWFGHVELHSLKSTVKWQGYGKSAREINREHVDMAMRVRRPKYVALIGD